MIILATNQISKDYGFQPILKKVSIEVHSNDRIGIVGPNGAGKTTLFRILQGMEPPDRGEIYLAKGKKVAYLPQSPHYPEEWTGRDVIQSAFQEVLKIAGELRFLETEMADPNCPPKKMEQLLQKYQTLHDEFEHHHGYEMEVRMDQVIHGLKVPEAQLVTPFQQLSGGEKTKIGLARLLCVQSDLLLLDEPTNHLDVDSMEWLEGFLKQYEGAVLVISHDRYFLDHVAQQIYEIDGGELTKYTGNYRTYVQEREARILREFAQYEEQQKKIKKMQETIKRLKEWGNRSNPPNEAFHRRAKSMEKALARIEKIERPRLEQEKMGLTFQKTDRSGQDVIWVENLTKRMDEKVLFDQAHLKIRYGERKALLGPNGSGKTTLIKMLLKEIEPDEGMIRLGSSVKVGYLSQQAIEGEPNRTVLDVFREVVPLPEGEARNRLAQFMFYGANVFKKVGNLSGGERMRLRLAQLMEQEINLLILDEPTNHLDIPARETLEEALEQYRGTLLIVSHDRYFLQKVVDGVVWIEDQELLHDLGSYEEARVKQIERRKLSPSSL